MASKRDIKEWEAAFEHCDTNKNGSLCIDELRKLLTSGDSPMTEAQVQIAFICFDGPEGDQRITLEEFISGLTMMQDSSKSLEEFFKASDTNNSGSLEKDEIKSICAKVYPAMSDEDAEGVFNGADQDGDGKITLEEFLAACT